MVSPVFLLSVLSLGVPFTDGAVLQRDHPVPVWGTANAGERVMVSFAGHDVEVTAGSDGKWRVTLPAMPMSDEPRTLCVISKTSQASRAVSDILVGDVWIACGQSNMDVPLVGPDPKYRDRQGEAVAGTTRMPLVRWNVNPFGGTWRKFIPGELSREKAISAVAFYFARAVHGETGVPIGLICAHCGGTNIEAWTPKSGYASTGLFPELLNWKRIPQAEFTTNHWHGAIRHWSKQPFMAFERRLADRAPYAVKGVLWYQGEQNAAFDAETYDGKLEALLKGLEIEFENPDLRFYMVQIPPPCAKPPFQAAQRRFVRSHEGDGRVRMVSIDDVTDVREVHPADKEPVGWRLARLALRYDYGIVDDAKFKDR